MLTTKKQRSKPYQKLRHPAEAIYGSYWMAKFINRFMRHGKKAGLEKIIFQAFKDIKKKTKRIMLPLLLHLLLKFRPLLGFISKRFSKQFKKIPVPLYPRRQIIVSLKWLVTSIKINAAWRLQARLLAEFVDLHLGQKSVLAKRYTDHLIEINENRLNHRFRWK